MRNWNWKSSTSNGVKCQVFTVPMRNWNHITYTSTWMYSHSFYSTYEELKLDIISPHITCFPRFLQYLWGIETGLAGFLSGAQSASFYSTYEELKLLNPVTTPLNSHCFYSTYEELKPGTSNPSMSVNTVFTVPMRNWNAISSLLHFISNPVFTVPMRNWNIISLFNMLIFFNVFTVPMRNWNSFS